MHDVAALFVARDGIYFGLPDVDPWDETRDARLYAGPLPVVAHPPCARWSRFAGFCESRFGLRRGDDGGCFASALAAVRRFGGVLEHPAYSDAWAAFDLPDPPHVGWGRGLCGGWTAHVEQGRYGHNVKKATWLYAYRCELPSLRWGRRLDASAGAAFSWRDASKRREGDTRPRLTKTDALRTPIEFRDVLLAMARSARRSDRGAA